MTNKILFKFSKSTITIQEKIVYVQIIKSLTGIHHHACKLFFHNLYENFCLNKR